MPLIQRDASSDSDPVGSDVQSGDVEEMDSDDFIATASDDEDEGDDDEDEDDTSVDEQTEDSDYEPLTQDDDEEEDTDEMRGRYETEIERLKTELRSLRSQYKAAARFADKAANGGTSNPTH